jgi:DNA-binding MarR family transcriptional regulator
MPEDINYEEKILLAVRKIMRAIDMHSSYLARQYGLTSPQLICLKKLAEDGITTPGALAKSVHLSHATVTGIINRLEKKGLLKRARNMADGRSFQVEITDPGLSMLKTAPSMLQDHFMEELSKLQEWEKSMILSSIQRVTAMLSVEAIDVAPVLTTGPVEAPAESISDFLNKDVLNEEEKKDAEQ